MTPDQRLNQIEPELAELLQKVDRLIEGQGQLIDLSISTKAESEQVKAELSQMKATGEITATGLANLTLVVNDIQQQINQRFDRSEQTQTELKAGQTQLESSQVDLKAGLAQLEVNQTDLKAGLAQLAGNQVRLEGGQARLESSQARLESNQVEILTILRERLG